MEPGDDGLVRLTLRQMRELPLVHLMSGLDEAPAEGLGPGVTLLPRCGCMTTLSGYTEWLGGETLTVTLGWDWCLDLAHGTPSWRRLGEPRSNVQLVDAGGRDLVYRRNLVLLGAVVDTLPWAAQARDAIAMRYAA